MCLAGFIALLPICSGGTKEAHRLSRTGELCQTTHSLQLRLLSRSGRTPALPYPAEKFDHAAASIAAVAYVGSDSPFVGIHTLKYALCCIY